MPIKQITPKQAVDQRLEKIAAKVEKDYLNKLAYVGEECLKHARRRNTYKDQTGNLRSSIGYVIAKDGKVLSSTDFALVKNGKQGRKEGKELATSLAVKYSTMCYCLVVVAGMKYAYHVEYGHTNKDGSHVQGRDVIGSAELLAERLCNELFKA